MTNNPPLPPLATATTTKDRLPWKTPGRRAGILATLVLLALHAAPAQADIWGYVDEDRIPHFASSRVDDRYELFLRDNVEPYRLMDVARKAQDKGLDVAAVPAVAGATGAVMLSPRMAAFFDRSPGYKAASPLLREASSQHGIDYSLLKALIATESGFNTFAVSPKGAVGLMQLIPPTAERYGVTANKDGSIEKKLTDPKTNIRAGARYLAYLINMFPGRLELALAAYNAGEGAVQRAGNRIPNYPETQNYVKTVMQLYSGLVTPGFKAPTGRVHVELKGAANSRRASMPALGDQAYPQTRAESPRD
jgi:hypothetical protein